jgi:putative transposase
MIDQGYSVQSGCKYFEKSRQGYYYQLHSEEARVQFREKVVNEIKTIRRDLPGSGGRKLHYILQDRGIKIGRDKLFSVLREEGLLVKKKRKYKITTDSRHKLRTFDNLIKERELYHAEDVFVSDITYISTSEGFCYLSIVGDAYTKKILGYNVSSDMQSVSVVKALLRAVKNRKYQRESIHHSDRGSQYCSKLYVEALKLSNIMISMAGKGKAYENPVAERMIGILKEEYGLDQVFRDVSHAEKVTEQAINSYNYIRPHLSCGYLTPEQAHEKGEGLENVWIGKSYSHIHKRKKEAKKEKVLLQKV